MEVEVWPENCNGTLHLWDPGSRGLMLNNILEITLGVACMGGVDFLFFFSFFFLPDSHVASCRLNTFHKFLSFH